MSNIAIKVEALEKHFSVGNKSYGALRGVDLEVKRGEFAIIYGPSGSGKSTLLNCIIGLEPPTLGAIWIDGDRLDTKKEDERAGMRSRKFGVVYQQAIWVKALSVLDNVAMPLIMQGERGDRAKEEARKVLELMGLKDLMNHKPSEISGGQQQRASLARAMITNPSILILDEPTGNLDTHSADEVFSLLHDFRKDGQKTIIMVTHNLVYLPHADKTISIIDGKVDKITTNTEEILASITGANK